MEAKMKKLFLGVLCGGMLVAFTAQAGDEYGQCLELNFQTDAGLIKCAEQETTRVMSELDKRYAVVAGHKYFRPWNNDSHSFAALKTAWLKYRDDACNLLGYSLITGGDEYGKVEEVRCKLRETLRFQKDIETLVKNYQKTLPQAKL